MGNRYGQCKKIGEKIQELSLMVKKAKAEASLRTLNKYLRELIMGPYGDTRFDVEDIRRQLESNNKWENRSRRRHRNFKF